MAPWPLWHQASATGNTVKRTSPQIEEALFRKILIEVEPSDGYRIRENAVSNLTIDMQLFSVLSVEM